MNGPDYFKPVQSDIAANQTLSSGKTESKSASRQQKLDDLKAKISSGQYRVDLQQLAQRLIESDVLNSD